MKEWMKNLWNQSGKWFLIGLPLAALVIGAAVWQANQTYEKRKEKSGIMRRLRRVV